MTLWGPFRLRLARACAPALAAALASAAPAQAQDISVSVSDNVIVLSDRKRSGGIELLSMTPDALEFSVAAAGAPEGARDGSEHLRWSPPRALVPPNRGVPLRVSFRPPEGLEPGEYVARLNVQSRPANPPPVFQPAETPEGGAGLSVRVPIVPVLPVTVYIRHKIDPPALEVERFEPERGDADMLGHFLVRKPAGVSFVGTVAVVAEADGTVLSRRRLRLGQTITESRVAVPRGDGQREVAGAVCLRVWRDFPEQGEPDTVRCN